jgi:hypothetical protein
LLNLLQLHFQLLIAPSQLAGTLLPFSKKSGELLRTLLLRRSIAATRLSKPAIARRIFPTFAAI